MRFRVSDLPEVSKLSQAVSVGARHCSSLGCLPAFLVRRREGTGVSSSFTVLPFPSVPRRVWFLAVLDALLFSSSAHGAWYTWQTLY